MELDPQLQESTGAGSETGVATRGTSDRAISREAVVPSSESEVAMVGTSSRAIAKEGTGPHSPVWGKDVAVKALDDRLKPAGRKALTSAELLRRKQRPGEPVDEYVQAFEKLFEKSYGCQVGIDDGFKATLKRDLFVQGLMLKWQEKVLPTAESFSDALHQARTAEEQQRQLAEMHKKEDR